MPVAIAPVIASAFVAAGVGAVTAGILAQVVIIAVGIGISLLAQVLFSSKPAQPKPSDGQVILRQSTGPRTRAYGRVKVGGTLVFANTQSGAYGRVIAMGSGEIDAVEEHWIDDTEVTLSGNTVTTGKYQIGGQSKAFIEFRLGEDMPAPYGSLISSFPALWSTAHLGRGIPSAFFVIHQAKSEDMGNIFPSYGSTNYRQVQRGAKVPSIAGGALTAPEWSDNAARVLMDFLIHPDGLGLHPSWITNAAADWAAAIATCDEAIPVGDGTTEARYRIWGTYRFDERPADILTRFLHSCDASISATAGRGLSIKVGKWTAPTVSIGDDAILGFSEFGRGRDVLSTANIIRARYTSPDHDYLETDADPWIDEDDVAARGEFAADIDLFPVPSHSQCRRLMKVAAARANPTWVGVLQCNCLALPVMGERFVYVTISELAIYGQTFEVLSAQLVIEQGSILTGVNVQIASLDASAYDWMLATQRTGAGDGGTPPAIPPPIVPDNTLPGPTGIVLVEAGNMAAISWDDPPEDYIRGEVRYKQVALPDWLAAPVADDSNTVHIGPLAWATTYEFQVRHRSGTSTRVSEWTTSFEFTVEDEAIPPEPGIGTGVIVVTPADGATVAMGDDDRELYIDTPALAALTIMLPNVGGAVPLTTADGNPVTTADGNPVTVPVTTTTSEDLVELCFAAEVAALDIQDAGGATVATAPTSAYGPGAAIYLRWVDELSEWKYWK